MKRGCWPLTLTLSPQAGRGNGDAAPSAFSPAAGRRCRQADEGAFFLDDEALAP